MRVKHYECHITRAPGEEPTIITQAFVQSQVESHGMRGVVEPDGLDIATARHGSCATS